MYSVRLMKLLITFACCCSFLVIDRYRFFITDTDYLYVYVLDNRYAEPIFIYCYKVNRAVTIHQTHDSVRITIFDPRFGSYHDFFVGGWEKKKERFLKQSFLLNNILKIFIN